MPKTGIFLLVGVIISLLAGRVTRARRKAEMLVVQLQTEQQALHQAKQEADAQAHQLEAIFEAVTDALLVLGANEQVIFANAAFRALLNW